MNFKRTFNKERVKFYFGLLFICSFIILNTSCGLDVYYFLVAPVCNDVRTENNDPALDYFIFKTAQSGNYSADSSSAFTFSGTEIYYKIYTDSSSMIKRESTIDSYIDNANSSSNSSSATAAMDQLESWGYQKLKFTNKVNTPDPLIVSNNSTTDEYVYIRLVNSYAGEDYQACICVGSSAITKCDTDTAFKDSSGNILAPLRIVEDSSAKEYKSFAFASDSSDSLKTPPASSDVDVYYTSSSNDTWYVDLYAVSVGFDTATYVPYYSQPAFLGYMAIPDGDYSDN